MSTITREQLRERAREKVKSLEFAVTQAALADSRVELEEELELARIALASLEAEPLAYIFKHPAGRLFWSLTDESNKEQCDVMPVYTTPPATVSVPDEVSWEDVPEDITEDDMALASAWAHGFNQCRAAMLQGAEPVTTANKLPANTPCKDAPVHIWLQTAGVWPENGEFSELTWCSDNQHEDDTLYVRADVVTGNSPVIPNGWVMVPVEPTYQMCEAMGLPWERPRFPDRYKAMLAAAPVQEAK